MKNERYSTGYLANIWGHILISTGDSGNINGRHAVVLFVDHRAGFAEVLISKGA